MTGVGVMIQGEDLCFGMVLFFMGLGGGFCVDGVVWLFLGFVVVCVVRAPHSRRG